MSTPPRRPSNGIDRLNYSSADQIKRPNPTQPVADRDINYGWPTNDLDFAQLFAQLGNAGVQALHTRADTDSHPYSVHHTLGTSRNQAASGDHIHDGSTSKLLGTGMGLSISGAQIGNPALASLIAMLKNILQFTDASTPGAFDTWHAPAFNANWSGSTTFNGSTNWGSLQYKKDELNNFYLVGGFKAGATLPTNPICTFPAGYTPSAQWPIAVMRNNGGTLSTFFAEITTGGNFDISSQPGGGIAVNNEYLVASTIIPM